MAVKFTEWEKDAMKLVVMYVDMRDTCRNRTSCAGCPINEDGTIRLACDIISPLELIQTTDESRTMTVLRTASKAFRPILDDMERNKPSDIKEKAL